MAGLEVPSAIATFAEVLALGAAEQVQLFERAHRRSVSGRYEEVVTLTAIEESRAYEAAGCSSIQQFGARIADYTEREVCDMLRIGRTLKECPELDAAFRSGRLSWSKVRTLNPVVTRENAAKWIETAEHMTTAMLEQQVGKRREPNGKPWMVPMPEVASGVFVTFRTLCERLRQKLGEPGMPDGECAGVLFAMAAWAFEQHPEEALGALGYADVDRDGSTSTSISRSGDAIPHVGDSPSIDMAAPAEPATAVATSVREPTSPVNHSRHIPDAERRLAMVRASFRCEAPDCGNRHALEVHHVIPFADGGPHVAENLRVVCWRCHDLWHRSHATEAVAS